MIRNQKSYEDARGTALFNGMSVSSRKTNNQSYKRESFHYTSHQPSPGNLQDGMSLPGTNSLPLTQAPASVPSAASALSQHAPPYLPRNTLSGPAAHLSATAVNFHLNPHGATTSSPSALSLTSHSQGPTPASTPPAVPHDTKGSNQYQQNYSTMNPSAFRPVSQQPHTMYVNSNPRVHHPRAQQPLSRQQQQQPVILYAAPPNTLFHQLNIMPGTNANIVPPQTPYQVPSSTATDQHQMFFAVPTGNNVNSSAYPSNYSMSRSAWNQGSRTTSQGAVPTPMVQSQPLYPSMNAVQAVSQQSMAPPVLKQKSRSHALPIIDPKTMEEIDVNENNPENENSMNNIKNKVTMEVDKKTGFNHNSKRVSESSSNDNAPVSATYTHKDSTSSVINGSVSDSPFVSSSSECWTPLNNSTSVDSLTGSLKSSNVSSTIQPTEMDYKRPTREPPIIDLQPLHNTKSRERQTAAAWQDTPRQGVVTVPSQVNVQRGANVTKKVFNEAENDVSGSLVGSAVSTSIVSVTSSPTVSSDGVNKAASVTSSSVVLGDNEVVHKNMTSKQGILGATVASISVDTLHPVKSLAAKQPVSTATNNPLPDISQNSSPAGGTLPAPFNVTKSDVKSQTPVQSPHSVPHSIPGSIASIGAKPPVTALHTSGPVSEKPSPVQTQSAPFGEPFPSKTVASAVTSSQQQQQRQQQQQNPQMQQQNPEKTVVKEDKSNPSTAKTKNRNKEQSSDNASVDHSVSNNSNSKSKAAQPVSKNQGTDNVKATSSVTQAPVSSKQTNGESAESTATESKSRRRKPKKEINKKGSEKEGSDMDMFTNIDKTQTSEKAARPDKSNSSHPASVNTSNSNRSKSNSSQISVNDVKESVKSATIDSVEKLSNIPAASPAPLPVNQSDKTNKTDQKHTEDNKSGLKKYSVSFMMELKDQPQCKIQVHLKCNSPLLFPNSGGGRNMPQNGGSCFLPSFATSHSQNMSSQQTRKSQQGSIGRRDKPNQIHYSLSMREEVPLRRAKDAWRPSVFSQDSKNLDEETKISEALYKAVRGILNKLTPEKFQVLMEKFRSLQIDTADRLKEVIQLIFQKAIDEPGFCKWYALMCQEMQSLSVPDGNGKSTTFRVVLLNQCQAQFECDKAAELDAAGKKEEIEFCTNPEKKKELQLLWEENERRMRRKSVGNCRFIGELFKLKMLTSKIMLSCISQLLSSSDEEQLECLCKLLTTIGKELDTKERKDLTPHFKKMQEIADEKKSKVSSRIRFMILDVIDLKANKWVPRREIDNPKTIGEMNIELEKKEQEQKMAAAIATRKSYDDYSGNRNRDVRRNRNDHQPSDEWKTVSKNSLSKPFKVDSSKFSNLQQSSQEPDALGPPSLSMWRAGSGAAVKSVDKKNVSSTHVSDRLSVTRGSSSGKLTPSASMERSKQYPTPRDNDTFKMSRSESAQKATSGSRESSTSRPAPSRTPSQSSPAPSNVPPERNEEELMRYSQTILKEYFLSNDLQDSIAAFEERFNPKQIPKVLEEFLNLIVMDNPKMAGHCGKLLVALIRKKIVSLDHIVSVFTQIMSTANDLLLDCPQMWNYFSDILSTIFNEDCLKFKEFEAAFMEQYPNEKDGALLTAVRSKLRSNSNDKITDKNIGDLHKILVEKLNNESFESTNEWIDANVENPHFNSTLVIALTEALCEILYQKFGAQGGKAMEKEVNELINRKFRLFFRKYADNHEQYELDCLQTVEQFAKKNQFPNGFLLMMFKALADSKTISHEGFLKWKTTRRPDHGVAVSSLRTFYESITDDEESPSTS